MVDWWHQSIVDASRELLSLGAPEVFMQQADQILSRFTKIIRASHLKFSARSRARRKAVWLLHADTLGALQDALQATRERRLRLAAASFRMADETMTLAAYLGTTSRESAADLKRWYQNETIDHDRIEKWLAKTTPDAGRHNRRSLYHLTRRGYSAMLHSCQFGAKRRLAHVEFLTEPAPVPLETLAEYCAVAAWLMSRFGEELVRCRMVSRAGMNMIWQAVLGDGARCAIRTRSGRRCQRFAVGKGGRCWQHRFAT